MNFRHLRFVRGFVCLGPWLTLAIIFGAASVAGAQTAEAPGPKLPPTMAKVRDTGVVTIAYRPDAIPFAYLDDNKQPIGYGIDICREIVRLMERDLKRPLRIAFVEVSARTRFDVVNSGKADMECGTTINDPQRRKTIDYSMPYQFSGPRFLVRSDSKIRAIQDLVGRRISVVPGTNSVPLLKQRIEGGVLPGAVLVEYKSYDEAREAVERGEVEAFATIDVLLAAQRAKVQGSIEAGDRGFISGVGADRDLAAQGRYRIQEDRRSPFGRADAGWRRRPLL